MPASESTRSKRRLLLSLPLLACGLYVAPVLARPGIHQDTRTLMGTRVDLTLQGGDARALELAADAAWSEMARLAGMMSRYRRDSAVSAINLAAGIVPVEIEPELMQVLLMARRVAQESGGAFDATVGALHYENFDAAQAALPNAREIAAQLPLVNASGLILDRQRSTAYLSKRGMSLDLGGIAKLPILDAGMRTLRRHGVANAMINGGGDVQVAGQLDGRPWKIGLRDPRQPERLLGTVALSQGFVASSGDYERFVMRNGQRIHHIIDPKTGYPSHGPHGVTLIGDSLEHVNGLGTAIMVAGAAAGRRRVQHTPGLDALIVDADNSLWLSPGMQRRLTA